MQNGWTAVWGWISAVGLQLTVDPKDRWGGGGCAHACLLPKVVASLICWLSTLDRHLQRVMHTSLSTPLRRCLQKRQRDLFHGTLVCSGLRGRHSHTQWRTALGLRPALVDGASNPLVRLPLPSVTRGTQLRNTSASIALLVGGVGHCDPLRPVALEDACTPERHARLCRMGLLHSPWLQCPPFAHLCVRCSSATQSFVMMAVPDSPFGCRVLWRVGLRAVWNVWTP